MPNIRIKIEKTLSADEPKEVDGETKTPTLDKLRELRERVRSDGRHQSESYRRTGWH